MPEDKPEAVPECCGPIGRMECYDSPKCCGKYLCDVHRDGKVTCAEACYCGRWGEEGGVRWVGCGVWRLFGMR